MTPEQEKTIIQTVQLSSETIQALIKENEQLRELIATMTKTLVTTVDNVQVLIDKSNS